jgi:hypothetical protein
MTKKKMKGIYTSVALVIAYGGSVYAFLKGAAVQPQWGPLVGGAFGCFAFSISVQQAYAWSAYVQSPHGGERAVYLWSFLTLLFLGSGTVLGCLPNESQLGFSESTQRHLFGAAALLYICGFIFLFRFSAAYLYRGTTSILSNSLLRGLLVVFDPEVAPFRLKLYEIAQVGYSIICIGAVVLPAYINESLMPLHVSGANPIYFPFPFPSKFILGIGLAATLVFCILFFWDKYVRVRANGEDLDGVQFITVMGILFFVPVMLQATAYVPSAYGIDWNLSYLFFIWFVLLVLLTVGLCQHFLGGVKTNSVSVGRAVCLGLFLSSVICLVLAINSQLAEVMPLGYLTLGFLTLACAYLPIFDLEQSKAAS